MRAQAAGIRAGVACSLRPIDAGRVTTWLRVVDVQIFGLALGEHFFDEILDRRALGDIRGFHDPVAIKRAPTAVEWNRTAGNSRVDWTYGANVIEGGTLDDFWAIMEHFP